MYTDIKKKQESGLTCGLFFNNVLLEFFFFFFEEGNLVGCFLNKSSINALEIKQWEEVQAS